MWHKLQKYDNKISEVELKQLITKFSALEVKQELRGRCDKI